MLPYLPPELLRIIITNLSESVDLSSTCLASKTFLSIARPLLYDTISFLICEFVCLKGEGCIENRTQVHSDLLRKTLQYNSSLCRLVRKVNISACAVYEMEWRIFEDYTKCDLHRAEFVEAIVQMLPSVRSVELENLYGDRSIDDIVHRLQIQSHAADSVRKRSSSPAYSLIANETWLMQRTLKSAYGGFHWYTSSYQDQSERIKAILQNSEHSLQTLSIPLSSSTSLSRFRSLKRLSLSLPRRKTFNLIDSLVRAISDLPAIHTLLLDGSARDEKVSTVLGSSLFSSSLPPTLVNLSLNYHLPSVAALTFLAYLPTTTNLKEFNCLGESDEMEEARGEFRKRGMGLNLNEEWDI